MGNKTPFQKGTCKQQGYGAEQKGGPGDQYGVDVTNWKKTSHAQPMRPKKHVHDNVEVICAFHGGVCVQLYSPKFENRKYLESVKKTFVDQRGLGVEDGPCAEWGYSHAASGTSVAGGVQISAWKAHTSLFL